MCTYFNAHPFFTLYKGPLGDLHSYFFLHLKLKVLERNLEGKREKEEKERELFSSSRTARRLYTQVPLFPTFILLPLSLCRCLYRRTVSPLAPRRVIEDTDRFPTLRLILPRLVAVTLRVPTEPLLHPTLELETLLALLQPSLCETIS